MGFVYAHLMDELLEYFFFPFVDDTLLSDRFGECDIIF